MINFNIETFYLFFQSETWRNIISIIKPVCFFAIFLFIIVIIWSLKKSTWASWYINWDLANFSHGGPVAPETAVQKRWKKIRKRIESPSDANWKLGIIESEEIIENILSEMGYKGEGIIEKLKGVDKSQIPNISDLTSAYDIFINILADPDYKVHQDKAIKTISSFEEFLRNFELL